MNYLLLRSGVFISLEKMPLSCFPSTTFKRILDPVRPLFMNFLTNRTYSTDKNNYSIQTSKKDEDAPIPLKNPYVKAPRKCILCKLNITPDYKNVQLLSQSPYTGRLYGKHITGLCQEKQTQVENEIMKARNCGFMGYLTKSREFLKDPKLFDPDKPLRRHKF